MEDFICPSCANRSRYNPWAGPARCPHCGFTPPERPTPGQPPVTWAAHQPFLDQLLAHWSSTPETDPQFTLKTQDMAYAFFQEYRRALGEDPGHDSPQQSRYVRNYPPRRRDAERFAGAYLLLRWGKRSEAASILHDLTEIVPEFADPWIWLTATTDDPALRIAYLERAVALEPAHPLARDALAIARGRVSIDRGPHRTDVDSSLTVVRCPDCGGSLHYEPGAGRVTCPYCGHGLELVGENVLDGEARLVGDLQLQRRYRGAVWSEATRAVSCRGCGAMLTMTHHLVRQCVFCGSTHVVDQGLSDELERPDGFVPFKLSREDASSAIHEVQTAGLRAVGTWLMGGERQAEDIQPLYLPFWAFDGFVEVRTWRTQTSWQFEHNSDPASDSELLMIDNLLFIALDALPPALVRRILPFEVDALVPYEPQLLADWPAALYNRDVGRAAEDARNLMLATARRLVSSPPASSTEGQAMPLPRRTYQVTSLSYQLVLLPVWIALVERDGQRSLALVNGQSGRVAIGPPVSEAHVSPGVDS